MGKKVFPQPTVSQLDSWYKTIGGKAYKITIHETTPSLYSKNRIFYTCSFYMEEYYRHDRVVYERLSREEIEVLFDSTIKRLSEKPESVDTKS